MQSLVPQTRIFQQGWEGLWLQDASADATEQIRGLIETFAKSFNIKLKGVPGRSTVENMVVELGLISDFQVAALLYNSRNVTIAFDATMQYGTHVNEIHATTNEKCLVMSLEELAGWTAKDYANHIIKLVEHLAQTLCTFRVEEQSIGAVNKTLQSHITCSVTDSAAANHAAIRTVNKAFKTTLLEVNCHLHPLDTIATKCRSTLKSLAHGIEKSKLFGQGREMFYLTTHSTHFIYGYMASDIWLRTNLIVRKETCCPHIGYSFRLTARVLLYAPSQTG